MSCLQPLHSVDGADDVDDRVERADLVQVHLVERRMVDRRLRFAQTFEELNRAVFSFARQRGPLDTPGDVLQIAMMVACSGDVRMAELVSVTIIRLAMVMRMIVTVESV